MPIEMRDGTVEHFPEVFALSLDMEPLRKFGEVPHGVTVAVEIVEVPHADSLGWYSVVS